MGHAIVKSITKSGQKELHWLTGYGKMADVRVVSVNLVDELKARQRRLGLTDEQMAQRLRVTRPMWSMIRNGKLPPGKKSIEGVVSAFPDLQPEVLLFLHSRVRQLSTTGAEHYGMPVGGAN